MQLPVLFNKIGAPFVENLAIHDSGPSVRVSDNEDSPFLILGPEMTNTVGA